MPQHVLQVIAPLLVIQRVANQSALTSETIATGNEGSINFRSQGSSTDGGTIPGGHPTSTVGMRGKNPDELGIGVGVGCTIDFGQDEA